MKILIVITSNSETGTPQRTGLWLEEFTTPYYLFRDAQIQITLASPAGGTPPVDPLSETLEPEPNSNRRFLNDPEAREQFMNTVPLSEVDPSDFDAVYYPGGHGVVWDLPEDLYSRGILESFLNSGRPAGLVCHAPAALRHVRDNNGLPFIAGKRFSGTTNSEERKSGLEHAVPFLLEDELTRLGGRHEKAGDGRPCVISDGNLVTGQNPASSSGVAQGVLSLLRTAVVSGG